MTAEEFRSSQLNYLCKNIDRVRRLLYPGLSEALRSQLGDADDSTPRQDGYIRRYDKAWYAVTCYTRREMFVICLCCGWKDAQAIPQRYLLSFLLREGNA